MAWLVPTLWYVLALGGLSITSKLALRGLVWQDLILWSGIGYVFVATYLVLSGQAGIRDTPNTWWAVLSAAIAITGLKLRAVSA